CGTNRTGGRMAKGAERHVSFLRRTAPSLISMLKLIKQARAAVSMLNPDEVRGRAERPVHVGLVASGPRRYAELEQFLASDLPGRVHRADHPKPPATVDIVIYQHGAPSDRDAYTFDRYNPEAIVR